MKKMLPLIAFFLLLMSVMGVSAAVCDFAWGTAVDMCSSDPKKYGGITGLEYSAATHKYKFSVAATGTATEFPMYKRAYYTVKDGTGGQDCLDAVWVDPLQKYQWCPLMLSSTVTPYSFLNPRAQSKWVDARLAAISVTDIQVVGDHFLDGQENFLAVFICGCTSDCSHSDNWECNPRTGGGMGPHNGRWIIMPFNRCIEGEKRLVPDPNPPGDFTQAYECKNGQWQEMKLVSGTSCSSSNQCSSNNCVTGICQ